MLDVAFAGDFSDEDWDHSLGGTHYWIEDDGGAVISHGSVVERVLVCGERQLRAGYVEAVATAAEFRRRGYGAEIMRAIGTRIQKEWELGALSTDVQPFYARLGWEVWRGPVMGTSKNGRVRRMKDEEGGIMILRTATSADLDVGQRMVAGWRAGDIW